MSQEYEINPRCFQYFGAKISSLNRFKQIQKFVVITNYMEKSQLKAVIFDMDGVIIDSEPLWAKAEFDVFSSVGVTLTEALCRKTASMTTREVKNFWFERFPWKNQSLESVENRVIDLVGNLIQTEGQAIDGIRELVMALKDNGLKIGLATNSPERLIPLVLEKVGVLEYFDAWSSVENEENRKPYPDVYLSTARKLEVNPEHCMAIEDSSLGLEAAKKAGMFVTVLAKDCVPVNEYSLADQQIGHYRELIV